MGEYLIENEIYVAKLFGTDLQGNDLYKFEPLKQIDNATFVKVTPEFKRGDILKSNQGTGRIVIFNEYTSDNYFESIYSTIPSSDKGWLKGWLKESFRHATEEEKQKFFDELKADGKWWNAEKLIVEDIPQPKFKIGEKVRFKKGGYIGTIMYDELALTVSGYCNQDQNILDCKGFPFFFHEDWFEHYVEELTIEDIPQPKFKAGDEVRIKKGISSKTHRSIFPVFMREMDDYIGQKLVINNALWYTKGVYLYSVDKNLYSFLEDWLEPYVEEPKKGDLAIFWDDGDKGYAIIKLYDRKGDEYHRDSSGSWWGNAIKFESKEQFEKVLNGEI